MKTTRKTTSKMTNGRQTNDKQTTTNKNDKNDKNEKNKKEIYKENFGEFGNVKLTNDEYDKIKQMFPNDYDKRIQALDDYIQSKGKKYKDFVATLKNWARKEGYIFPEKKEQEQVLLVRDEYLTEEEWDRYRSGKMTNEEFKKILEERQCMM